MGMYKHLIDRNDLELLQIHMGDPKSAEGIGAETLLRYRQYLALKSYNRWLIIFTIVLAISAIVQAVSAWRSSASVQAPINFSISDELIPTVQNISVELGRIRESLDRSLNRKEEQSVKK